MNKVVSSSNIENIKSLLLDVSVDRNIKLELLKNINIVLKNNCDFDKINELIKLYNNNFEIVDIIKELDFDFLLGLKENDMLASLVFLLKYDLNLKEYYNKLLDCIFKKHLINYGLYNILTKIYDGDEQLNELLNKYLQEVYNYLEVTSENYLIILNEIKNLCYDELPTILKLEKTLGTYINKEPLKIYEDMIVKTFIPKVNIENHEDCDSFCEIVAMIIKEIVENENADYMEVNYKVLNRSLIISVKDKYIKISNIYRTYEIPKIPYLLQSLLRKEFDINNQKLYIEVTPRVETENITMEEVYTLYKKIRAYHLIWADAATRNVGRLLSDNVINFKKDLNPSNEVLGYNHAFDEDIILKRGDLVILDNDYLYYEDDPNIVWGSLESEIYEKKYQEELKKEVKLL